MSFVEFVSLAWRPALEVLILSVGIYYAFIFLRGSRGAPVVTGFLTVLLALTLTTRLLNLQVLNALLSQFFGFLAVAVVILFQPEIRRMLAEVGNLPVFSSAREQRENIETIIQTVDRLAPVKIGALLAIEQTMHLTEVVESGVDVDCAANPEMLETIFFPNNAIHDGGVVIRGDRILKAACIFPLTQRQDLHKSLGTRHRAAIGISEETDAIVVVVSEETGQISYAHRGQLVRNVTVEELRSFLTQVMIRRSEPRTWAGWARGLLRSPGAPGTGNPNA